MIRDAEFYRARQQRKLKRKLSRMRTMMLYIMLSDPYCATRWKKALTGIADEYGKLSYVPGRYEAGAMTHWRHRRRRAIVRSRNTEVTTAIEVAIHGISRAFATWPDTWEHKHYFGAPVGNVCNCGTCQHGIKNGVVACPFGCARATTADILKMAAVALAGLFIRDVQ